MTDPHDLSPDDDALAAEYVLGVLDLEDRLALEARIRADDRFAALVARWETHFEAFNEAYASEPAPDLMPRIEARLFGQQARPKRGWWGFVIGAGMAAALGIMALVLLPLPQGSGPDLTASLVAEAQTLAFAASYSDGELTLQRTAGSEAELGRDYELWLIVGDAAPVSLGLIKGVASSRVLEGLMPGAILAISLEPTGGSSTGAPTGPVLVSGVIETS